MGSTAEDIRLAVEALLRGELVVMPTDTVYGVAALASDDSAVARLYTAKGRDSVKPLPILIAELGEAGRVGELTPLAATLAAAFWPGPLTIVVPRRETFVSAALAGSESVGLRLPDHPTTREVIRQAGGVLAVSSANRSAGADPLTVTDARKQLGDHVSVYIDGGQARDTRSSTVVDACGEGLAVLREGPISSEALRVAAGVPSIPH